MIDDLPYALSAGGKLLDLSTPKVMGILNATPDSFYAGSRKESERAIAERAEQICAEGGDMIDVGACSTRPNAAYASREEEAERMRKALAAVRKAAPEAIVSVDTFRADIAAMCVEEYGADIVNDVSGGEMDPQMACTAARLNVPYVMGHMKTSPPQRGGNLRTEALQYFARKIADLHERGVKDIVVDPGFGFGKTLEENYELFKHLEDFKLLGQPVLVGISRKSMIYNLLGGTPDDALNGTTALNAIALCKGAHILRVHDVKACAEAVRIFNKMNEQA